MRYRKLGSSDISVSEISLGSWLTYAGGVGLEQARVCAEAALDAGINFFDTSNSYGLGAAEKALGDILSRHPRDSYVVGTKLWADQGDGNKGLSAAQIAKQLDASLARLQTDYVDLYQAHRFDVDTPIEETVEAFQGVVDEGKARCIGFSEWTPEQIQAGIDVAGPGLFVSSQPQYSMLWRVPETEVFPLCQANGISQIVWSPLAQGLLTGKYRPGEPFPEDSRFADQAMGAMKHLILRDESVATVARLTPIAESAGLSMTEMALAWVLRRPELAAAIVGASRPEQVRTNAGASGIQLSRDVLDAIDEALGDCPVTDPDTLAVYAAPGVTYRT